MISCVSDKNCMCLGISYLGTRFNDSPRFLEILNFLLSLSYVLYSILCLDVCLTMRDRHHGMIKCWREAILSSLNIGG